MAGPKVLLFDVELSPIQARVWRLRDENIALNQIEKDWHLLSWAAKWLDKSKIYYLDQRHSKDVSQDKNLCLRFYELLEQAEVIVTFNGKKFDLKKFYARFIIHGLKPPPILKHVDVYQLCKKFGFSSHKLEWVAEQLCPDQKKSKHKKFPGFELWRECLKGNLSAWKEMEVYNKQDVITLEAVFKKIRPWVSTYKGDLYHEGKNNICSCGSIHFLYNGFAYTDLGKFRRIRCKDCGKEFRGSENLLPQDKRKTIPREIK